jgi:aconitase A
MLRRGCRWQRGSAQHWRLAYEDAAGASSYAAAATAGPQNLVEKIVQAHTVGLAPGQRVRSGDIVYIRPAHVMTHDNTMAVLGKFESLGVGRVRDPRQPVFALDHNVQDQSEKNLARYAAIEAFARRHGIDFYPAGRGIGHQVGGCGGCAFLLAGEALSRHVGCGCDVIRFGYMFPWCRPCR